METLVRLQILGPITVVVVVVLAITLGLSQVVEALNSIRHTCGPYKVTLDAEGIPIRIRGSHGEKIKLENVIVGDEGDNTINGATGDGATQLILGLGGNDTITAANGSSFVICGGEGNDLIYGADGQDLLLGDGGCDRIEGRGSRDRINGGDGDDRPLSDSLGGCDHTGVDAGGGPGGLFGDLGNDTLKGGPVMTTWTVDPMDLGNASEKLAGGRSTRTVVTAVVGQTSQLIARHRKECLKGRKM